jgi:hypothetical protein
MRCAPPLISYTHPSTLHYQSIDGMEASRLVVILAALLLILVLLLVLLLPPLTFLSLELLLPELVGGVFVEVGEDKGEDFVVPGYRTAFEAFFDVLNYS